MQDCTAPRKGGAEDHSCLGVLLVVAGVLKCLCGADDRSDWTARLAAAGRAAMTLRSLLLELRALPDLTETMIPSTASSVLQHPVLCTFPAWLYQPTTAPLAAEVRVDAGVEPQLSTAL